MRGPAFFAYADNYLVDVKSGIIMDVEASRAIRQVSHAKNDPRVHDEAESSIQRWAEDAQMATVIRADLVLSAAADGRPRRGDSDSRGQCRPAEIPQSEPLERLQPTT
jgi:hypothetical protein